MPRTTVPDRLALLVLALVFAGAASACAGAQTRDTGPPSWFPGGDRDAYPAGEWILGLGACGAETPQADRASCAAHRARRELAFSIRSEVEASVRMQSEAERERLWSTGRGGTDQSVTRETDRLADAGAVTTALEMVDVEPREVTCRGEHCYAMVAVRRRDVAARVARELAEDELRLERHLQHARQGDTLQAIQSLAAAESLARGVDRAGLLHQSLTGINPVDPPAVHRVHGLTRDLLSGASVCFASDLDEVPASEVFATSVARMRAMGFGEVRTAASEHDCAGALVIFRFEGTSDLRWAHTTLTDDQPVTMEYVGFVHFSTARQGQQMSRRLTARGMHVATPQAIDAATRRLSEEIHRFVEEVLAEGT
ncbi:MAG: hypothetical protein EA398_09360 [Deltaproteobacteria bacterium]|nr:MAG: hypothetical protein EA398_09360 [Deltaproteobacteria bacterium]